ncbi:MAG: sodium-translocating pyrophosphatase [Bacillota bacterium]|nr:sodium-translocating pyrophosphatase [Bacillota bacterium]
MELSYIIIYGSVLISILVIALLARYIFRQDKGTPEMQRISEAIKKGAMAFLSRQYRTILILSVVALAGIMAANYFGNLSGGTGAAFNMALMIGIAFVTGAACSALSGFLGMYIAVHANVRAAQGARTSLNRALQIALKGGAVTGLAVTALSLLGVATLFLAYGGASGNEELIKNSPSLIIGFGFGASFVALFAQLGGGIYTKAADVGADLVGKVEAGIPEDDPRNPAVIADLVGDNVGDCAGRGADLFESTAAENIGAMILGAVLFKYFGIFGMLFPLVARAVGILASIVGIFCVKVKNDDQDPMKALNKGYVITTAINIVALFFVVWLMLGKTPSGAAINFLPLFGCVVIGIALSYAFVLLTDYYTSMRFKPVRGIAKSCETGAATNIISGVAVGLQSTALPVLFIAASIYGAFQLGQLALPGVMNAGLYGSAVATMGMLSTCAFILAMDTFGPITDNAGGITEMSGASEEVRLRTDRLDACGNTTKALTKGYAVGSAALATFLLFAAYITEALKIQPTADGKFPIDIGDPIVFIGAFVGAMVVFLFCSTAIRAVGRAAQYVILEVRRQFKTIKGLMEGKAEPEYATCVDIVTKGALKEMVIPGLIVVLAPIIVGVLFGLHAVGGFLMVATITGVIMALFLNNSGGAWDNAKKYIELGNYGGKRSEAHKASVAGDTVGDPFKDTAGPSLHVLIKLISTITLVFVPLFVGLIK